MTGQVFADTFYFLALLSRRDAAHVSALRASREAGRTFLTTSYVLLESADTFAKAILRADFIALHEGLRTDPAFTIVPVSADSYKSGLTLYRSRPDKNWSLTDCISFVTMQQYGLIGALTGDRHFEQAGFRALLA